MKIPQFFSRIPFQKTIAAVLVMMILVSQTIHVDFFDTAVAGPENYRDIVSIIVDRDTYRVNRSRIQRYAEDIAGYLGGVRTSILVVDPGTPVATIAAQNEKLYYEGDGGEGVSSLVGTVLIGNIPVPIVEKDGTTFSSLYPYVDFVDKVFVYNPNTTRYSYSQEDVSTESVDIWHGVINPAVGRSWSRTSDINKIGEFLDKTHEFYTKSGKFTPSTVPPKVLYYDGLSESRSIDARSLFQYGLSIKNAENIAYNRFTKYLLSDISTALRAFDAQNADPDVNAIYSSLGMDPGSDTLSSEQTDKLPDIQTKDVTLGFLKNFKSIFNEKTLGDELLAVHNAGRYNSGARVGADLLPISITLMDDIARSTLVESNHALEKQIDALLVDQNYARLIPIFDQISSSTGRLVDPTSPYTSISQNYIFGTKSTDITSPLQCTIARGARGSVTEFGRSQLVEANVAFDIMQTEPQIEMLKADTELLVRMGQADCFPDSKPKIDSYWGGNSILRITGGEENTATILDSFPATKRFTGFTAPIFSLGGMKESDRIGVGGVDDCLSLSNQYTLSPARLMTYVSSGSSSGGDSDSATSQTCTTAYPGEWNTSSSSACTLPVASATTTPRYTCISRVTSSGTTTDFPTTVDLYSNKLLGSCLSGTLSINGTGVLNKNNTCIVTQGSGDDITQIDTTQYTNISFHTIPSLYHHTSPTDEEIAAAKANTVTPSLPVDMVRYVEFVTPKGNIARINYPNFFELPRTSVEGVRRWIKRQADADWQRIIDKENATTLSEKDIQANAYLSAGVLPSAPIDWNAYISDEMIARILQSRNWLNPDISSKYKQALESLLSYSHGAVSSPSIVGLPPEIPSLSSEYEIAYLGLPASFGVDFSQSGYSTSMDAYNTHLREIEGANISDESLSDGISESNNPATQCGPPDGVPLLQWPGAIMCWINAQFPPRILAGTCGPTTIGVDSPGTSAALSPSLEISTDTTAIRDFYSGSQLIAHLPRSSMQLRDSVEIDFSLQKNNAILNVPANTEAFFEIVSGTVGNKNIPQAELSRYLSLSPSSVPVSENGATFLVTSEGLQASLMLQGYYILPLPDGSETRIESAPFRVNITPEYYALSLEQSGATLSSIDITSSNTVSLRLNKISQDGKSTPSESPVSITIIDDITSQVVYSGSLWRPAVDTLPLDITKKKGVYRMIIRDATGLSGEMTFSVVSGNLSQVRIVPISSALVRGAQTLAMVRLLDRLGNDISPDLHSLTLGVSGGYMIDATGERRTSMNMDIMESQIPILLGSDTAGSLRITATVDGSIVGTKDLTIYDSARIVLMRDRDPRVGDPAVGVRLEIQDSLGQRMSGLSSVASWKLPEGAGEFSKESITITDGLSESFSYIPGTVSGNHSLAIDVPGIGSLSDIVFSLMPGDPLSISHTRDDSGIVFSLRDRYNNISRATLTGTLSYNSDAPLSITFTDGIYRMPLVAGYYTLDVPALSTFSIVYTDDAGPHRIPGADRYTAYIEGPSERIDFAPDYNARYTVLAGNSFLREGEDILYNTTPGLSQSLAVSTLLDTPYHEDILMSLFPGGSYQIGQSAGDVAIESEISISSGLPLLTLSDLVTRRQLARVLYPMQSANFELCQVSSTLDCRTPQTRPTIRIITPTETTLSGTITGNSISLRDDSLDIISIARDGTLILSPQLTLVPRDTSTLGLEMAIMRGGQEIATVIYMMDTSLSVTQSGEFTTLSPRNTPLLLSSGFSLQAIRTDPLRTDILGYKIVRPGSLGLDETPNAPNDIDSLGVLSELPAVGWGGNNTMLLAYAGGDTVGEATRFFHTYSMVNLGDPVAHIDHGRAGTQIDGIDRTIGSIVARGARSGIADFWHRDMDADGMEDILIVYNDGYIELLLNRGGKFRSRGLISYSRDIDSQKISFADFTRDGYGDIIGIDKNGSLVLIDNSVRRFDRRDIRIEGGGVVPTHISQLRISDMDSDTYDDIVYISASGELGILYGTATVGLFTKKILDPTLGITLSATPITVGGAIKSSSTPQFQGPIGVSPATSTGTDASVLESEVYYQYSKEDQSTSLQTTDIATLSGAFSTIENGGVGTSESTYVKSQYATAYSLNIQKVYTNTTHATLYPDDRIRATIRIENTSNLPIRDIEYLDTIPTIFSADTTAKYSIKIGDTSVSRNMDLIGDNQYDAHFVVGDIAPRGVIEISYELRALPASYGEMVVGDLEKGTVGADAYGDVGFKTSTTCGASMMLWSSGPLARDYSRGTHEFGTAELPDGLASRLTDADSNSIPDSIENMSIADRKTAYTSMTTSSVSSSSLIQASQDGDEISIGFDPRAVDDIVSATQDLMDGLSCGFGGGGCLSSPVNWAPLAPGSSPTIFGFPLAPNLMTPSAGLPIFSAMTGIPVYGPWGCIPIPSTYPPSPIGLSNTCTTNIPSAGGILGTWDPTNVIRIFVTPTLTLGMGTAICMGGPAIAMGEIPPPGLSPFIQGGNCIVITKPMNVCKSDGSSGDGDVRPISGLGTITDNWNASSCRIEANTTTELEDRELTRDIVTYLGTPDTTELTGIYSRISQRGSSSLEAGPLLTIGSPQSGGMEVSVEIDSNTKISDIGSVIKVKNKRIAAFPDFVMDWLTRQQEELMTSLFTPPNLTIIPPTSFGQNAQVDSSWENFTKDLGDAYSKSNFDNIKQAMGTSFNATQVSPKVPDFLKSTVSNTQGTLNSIKSAYTLIGKLPFISIQQVNIPINIPWFDKKELEKYESALRAYRQEIENAGKNWCVTDTSAACLDQKAKFQAGAFVSSIRENLKRIEEYKKFPMKIQKYITWKERYIAQILCNIDTIQQITSGWLRDNGVRFRKWAELFVLIKAIADGWQPLLDIFADTTASCGVCRNERNTLQYWKFKLISMLIPSIPVIKFPKWPDIVLDLSDVRLGINISMPNFVPRISPVRLPNPPSLSIGTLEASLLLPGFPVLPGLPELPDLPDLPSLPRIKLPDLPPPPKVPKIAGSITGFLSVMKLISKMYCFYQKTVLIPEWQVGDVIAQRTDRQGTLPFDFINLDLPQFSLPSIKEIRISSHVNYELRSDFISEFARSAVRPINEFQTDLQNSIPTQIAPDVAIPDVRVDVRPGASLDPDEMDLPARVTSMLDSLSREKDVFLEVDDFAQYLLGELDTPELAQARVSLQRGLQVARIESEKLQNELLAYNDKKFDLLRNYLSAENDNNAELQNIVDLLTQETPTGARQLISDMEENTSRSTRLLAEYNAYIGAPSTLVSDTTSQETALGVSKKALQNKMSRMMAATTGSLGSTTDATMDGYAPNYQGIYIYTPSGVQTRLFDYIAPVLDTTRVDTVDIDRDGDMDYLYMLDGILYVKYNWTSSPNKIIDTATTISSLSSDDAMPYIPAYFGENISTPQTLNFSFVPTSEDEYEWRVDLYDRYLEWDHTDIGDHDPRSASRATLDLLLTTPIVPVSSDPSISTHRVSRSLRSIADRDSFVIEGRSIDIYTGALSASVSPGRVLYTGDRRVTIRYTNESTPSPQTLTLDPHAGYEFSSVTEITTNGGRLYLIGGEDESRYTYSDDLIGLPILPGMRLYASDAGGVVSDLTSKSNISLSPGATYLVSGLGDKSDQYEVSLPYANGYYYARLQNLTDPDTQSQTQVVLFSPQSSSDDSAPTVNLGTTLSIPLYSTKSYTIADILTDLSPLTLAIDPDTATDTNNNSIFDDDFVTSGSGFSISPQALTFGPFSTPGKYGISLQAVDQIGNTTVVPVTIDVYTPIPQINSVTRSGSIIGSLAEPLVSTPVHFFRVRPSEGPILLSSGSTFSDFQGGFASIPSPAIPETITLKKGNTNIATMARSGALLVGSGYTTRVLPASATLPMRILLVDQSGSISHAHTLSLPDDVEFIDTAQTPTRTGTGVYVALTSSSNRVVEAGTGDVSIPGGIYIVDSAYRPLLGVARDGNIYTLDSTLTLRYRSQDGYIVIEAIRGSDIVATLEYRLDFFYTVE